MAIKELEMFVDETIRRGRAKGYIPTIFIAMRQKMSGGPNEVSAAVQQ